MGITSAMFTGVSGLKNYAEGINVVGNNIANVNTIGFKEGRMLFSDLLSANIGKDSQVGRGVQIQTVQNLYNQGSFENTSSATDLAIQGDGFFVVQDPQGTNYFSRAGAFTFNNEKTLTNPDGYQVMGYGIDSDSNASNGVLGSINLTNFATLSPKATTAVSVVANLNATEETMGTGEITTDGNLSFTTTPLGMVAGSASTDMALTQNLNSATAVGGSSSAATTVYDNKGFGHAATVTFTKTAADTWSWSAAFDDATSGSPASGTITFAGGVIASGGTASSAVTLNGNSQTIDFDFSAMTQNAAASNVAATQAGGAAIAGGVTAFDPSNAAATSNFAGTAFTAYDDRGTAYAATTYFTRTGFDTWEANTVISGVNSGSPIKHTLTFNTDGTLASQSPAATVGSSVTFASGQTAKPIMIDFAASDMTTAANASTSTQDGVAWNASDPVRSSHYSTSTTVYDSQGNAHTASIYFRKVGDNTWDWYGILPDATVGSPISGTLEFDSDGALISQTPLSTVDQNLTFANGVTAPQGISFDFGVGSTTQFASASAVRSQVQDGYVAGSFIRANIDSEGFVNAYYSSGQTKRIAQIALASFASNNGLEKMGGSLFGATTASGDALINTAGSMGSKVFSNSLEQSNVDLATQFVNLITLQRAYTANSKTITTTDEMTQELLNLKR